MGVLPTNQAITIAKERGLDLVEVTDKAVPPVCKIMDFGKCLYQLQKEEKQQKAKRKVVEIKSVRLTPRISKNDMQTRIRQAEKFLSEGNRVKIDMALRGREKALKGFAREKIDEFLKELKIPYIVEKAPENQPRGLSMIINKNNVPPVKTKEENNENNQ